MKPLGPDTPPARSYTINWGGTAIQPARPMTSEWRRWVAENVLLGKEPSTIVAAMVRDGFDQASAAQEVRAALEHPYIAAARAHTTGGAPTLDNQLKKREWVLDVYRRSMRQSSQWGRVPRIHKPSRQEFLDQYYALNQPVVIEDAMSDWAAIKKWTPDYLKRQFGERKVEVQANRDADQSYEINSAMLRQEMSFGEFVDITETAGQTNNYYITANNSGTNKEALRELWDDIVPFPEYLRDDPGNRGFFWFGPAGTITPLHHDLTNNFMAQVRGRKQVRLIAPCELPYLYNHRHCYSQVDLDRVDFDRFPEFRNAQVIDCVIGPGDLLFLPVGWWHYVRGLDVSITMTFTNFVFDNDYYSSYSTYSDI